MNLEKMIQNYKTETKSYSKRRKDSGNDSKIEGSYDGSSV